MIDQGGALLDAARAVVALAQAKGAQGVAAHAARSRELSVDFRDGKLEKLSEATSRGVAVELYVDGHYSAVSTSDLRPEALSRFLADAVAMARAVAKDAYRQLPDSKLYQGQAELDLRLEDPSYQGVTAPGRLQAAEALEAAARAVPGAGKITSVTASVGDTLYESALVHSNGFEGTRRATVFSASVEVSVKDEDGRRPEESHFAASRFHGALPSAEEIGRIAGERALGRLGSRKMPSAVLPMVVENRVGGSLTMRLLGSLSAWALQQKRSFLDGKKGQAVGSSLLDIGDDPLVPEGLASRRYDGEGIAARPMRIFDNGVLQNYYIDTYYGRKLGMEPTTGGSSNLRWKLGDKSAEALVAEARDGVYVTGFLGGNANGTTGDFSLGVQGFRIRDGRLAEPVAEINIAGNQLELWKRLAAVGADPYAYSSSRTPTLLFEDVQFAGT